MPTDDDWVTAAAILRIAAQLVDGIQSGLAARGFADVRPAHGFVFTRISAAPATTTQIAAHLGVTKQAAGQLVDQLIRRGYVCRETDPQDARARLIVLTERGHDCTRAAEAAASETTKAWRRQLTPESWAALQAALHALATPGRLRPLW